MIPVNKPLSVANKQKAAQNSWKNDMQGKKNSVYFASKNLDKKTWMYQVS